MDKHAHAVHGEVRKHIADKIEDERDPCSTHDPNRWTVAPKKHSMVIKMVPMLTAHSRNHARLAGMTVDSASADLPTNNVRYSFIKPDTMSHDRVWQSWSQ